MRKIDNRNKYIRRSLSSNPQKSLEAKITRRLFFLPGLNKFYGMKLLAETDMSQQIKLLFVSSKEKNGGFQLITAIVVFLLALSFQGAIVYIMISSLLQR